MQPPLNRSTPLKKNTEELVYTKMLHRKIIQKMVQKTLRTENLDRIFQNTCSLTNNSPVQLTCPAHLSSTPVQLTLPANTSSSPIQLTYPAHQSSSPHLKPLPSDSLPLPNPTKCPFMTLTVSSYPVTANSVLNSPCSLLSPIQNPVSRVGTYQTVILFIPLSI